MSRIPLLTATLLAASLTGCITPAKIATVETDATLPTSRATLAPAVVDAAPLPPGPTFQELIDQPVGHAAVAPAAGPNQSAQAQSPSLPPATFSVVQAREALPPVPPPPPLPNPPPPVTPVPPPPNPTLPNPTLPNPTLPNPPMSAAPAAPPAELNSQPMFRALQQITLDISPPTMSMARPVNYAAEALPRMANEQPFYRGDVIDYGFSDNSPVPPIGLGMCYQPLYFQELNAERYGRTWGIFQPAVSVASFYGRIPLLPYMAFAYPARRCTYHAHWALPGYKIPQREHYPISLSPAGGAAEAATIIGIILLIP